MQANIGALEASVGAAGANVGANEANVQRLRALLPGMYAQVKFSVIPADAVWLVPATALIARAAGPQVLSIRDDHTVHYQSVQLGRDLGQPIKSSPASPAPNGS